MLKIAPVLLRKTVLSLTPESSSLACARVLSSWSPRSTFVPILTHQHHPSARNFSSTGAIMSQSSLTTKIAVIGAGSVGSTCAYSLILNPCASQILLVDPQEEIRDAQVKDLSDATYHGNTTTQYVLTIAINRAQVSTVDILE